MKKQKYEISLWEDYLVPASSTIEAHYEEKKICTIGTDSMNTPGQAFDPVLVENINGTNTFTFKMYYIYREYTGEKVKNPFLKLLTNERKVKVFWQEKWYDFVIKNCQEDSNGKSITYTCKDLFINQLSKNGFDIVLDAELNNNSGTAVELAQSVLQGTDWILDTSGSDIIKQEKEEPVYEVTLVRDINYVKDDTTGTGGSSSDKILSGKKILVYYSQIQDFLNSGLDTKLISFFQFGYAENYERDTNSQLAINAHSCSRITTLKKGTDPSGINCITLHQQSSTYVYGYLYYTAVSSNYRAKRLVKSPLNRFDSLTEKYCDVYKATSAGYGNYSGLISTGDLIYSYRQTKWEDASFVNNLIINSKNFTSTSGWIGDYLKIGIFPPYTETTFESDRKTYLFIQAQSSSAYKIYNAAFQQASNFLQNGFSPGEKFRLRVKAYKYDSSTGGLGQKQSSGITPIICTYKEQDGRIIPDPNGINYFSNNTGKGMIGQYYEVETTCIIAASRSDLSQKKIGLFLNHASGGGSGNASWVEDIQFFKVITGENGKIIYPETYGVQSVGKQVTSYYNYTKTRGIIDRSDIVLLASLEDNESIPRGMDVITQLYNNNFEKVRSIDAKQSNRFNLLQDIAQTFQCWVQFQIKHDYLTGKLLYNSDGTPKKYVRLKEQIGKEVGIGFIYGIDLKTISRTIQSDQIVTKTIVTPNTNQFATNGFCTISRSKENYPRTTFILNFDYYVSQGLINGGQLIKDLYDNTNGLGYFYYLNKYNTEYDSLTDKITAKKNQLLKQQSTLALYEEMITSIISARNEILSEMMSLASTDDTSSMTRYVVLNADSEAVSSRVTANASLWNQQHQYTMKIEELRASINSINNTISASTERQKELIELIKQLDLVFYKKYARYIQQGTWTDEKYIDDNLYYLDAQSVAYTSSRPQISYNISVFRISGLQGYEWKDFNLGDISFVQDPEFFGYTYVNEVKTPYKEKVLIAEITSNFEEPDKDSFKVQNYKTQFEDLFQRITATTQSLQYSSGEYARAASIVQSNGTINAETLQNSILMNQELVYSARNETVKQDSTGITVVDSSNPNNKTKITSGGIFITTDGGTTWKNAIRGEGIATQWLTTGSINTNSINIMDGSFKTFRWDYSGINAYSQSEGGINLSKFVRYDHYGIYGINSPSGDNYFPESEDDIWEDANFGMTWKGFFVKNKYDSSHYVEVSSQNDIQVVSNGVAVIKIGKLPSFPQDTYGIRISDNSGAVVMETNQSGQLWLKDKLNISSDSFNVAVGHLPGIKTQEEDIHQVFNANNKFFVYEDGSMKATDGEFTGTIYATAGKIGNMSIQAVEQSTYKVIIESNDGTIFKNGQGTKVLTAKLYSGDTEITTGTFQYIWFKNNIQISESTKQITVSADSGNAVYTYTCRINYTS